MTRLFKWNRKMSEPRKVYKTKLFGETILYYMEWQQVRGGIKGDYVGDTKDMAKMWRALTCFGCLVCEGKTKKELFYDLKSISSYSELLERIRQSKK